MRDARDEDRDADHWLNPGQRDFGDRDDIAECEDGEVPLRWCRCADREVERERVAGINRIDQARWRRIGARTAHTRETDVVRKRLIVGLLSDDELIDAGQRQWSDIEIDAG